MNFALLGAHRCFCCPPVDPPNECIDSGGCDKAYGEQSVGECKDVTNPDFDKLSQVFDLNVKPTGENLCKNSVDKSCCRCLKKKPCLDDGCQDAFNGDGICLDVENDDLSMIDFSVEKKLGLCKNNLRKDCCFCYKKRGKTDCHQKSCTYEGMTGECVGPKGSPPLNHIKTPGECPGKDCVCWVPETERCSRYVNHENSSTLYLYIAGTLSVRSLYMASVCHMGLSFLIISKSTHDMN